MIPVERQTAVRTVMPTYREVFVYLLAATAALLACASGIDFHNRSTGFFGFVLQDANETGPTGVTDRAGQPAVLDHPSDVQAFHSDQAVATDQTTSDLMMMLAPQIANADIHGSKASNGLTTVEAKPFLPTDGAALSPKFRQLSFQKPGIRLAFPVTGSQKRFQPQVDSNRRIVALRNGDFTQVTRQNQEPLVAFPFDRSGFDCAFDGAMQLDSDRAHMLDAKPVAVQADAVAVGRKLDALKSVARLEARIARLLFRFEPTKERPERLVQSAHRGLGGGKVQSGKVRIADSLMLKPTRTIAVCYRDAILLISELPHVQVGIIQTAVGFEHDAQFPLLVGVDEQTVLKGRSHLFSLLGCDVLFYCFVGNVADCSRIITSGPQRRESCRQVVKLPPQNSRCIAFEAVDDLGDTTSRIRLDKQVNVVGHDFQGVNRHVQLGGFFHQEFSQSFGYIVGQNRPPIFRTPDNVIFQGKNRTGVIYVLAHVQYYTPTVYLSQEKGGNSPVA